jgi:murein L,D-transpeptidase YafK
MKIKRIHILLIFLALCICAIPFGATLRSSFISVIQILKGKKTVEERVEQYGEAARARLAPDFEKIGIAYPPERIVLVGLKWEGVLEVWVSEDEGTFKRLKTYPILGASGSLGPKLLAGDEQVPEGLYHIESLNPNSLFHLSLRLTYPNDFDSEKGRLDGRNKLGTDIMIHGSDRSIGCLAMGNEAAEDLFILAAEAGIENISVILSPIDFRIRDFPMEERELPSWTPELYGGIKTELAKLRIID